MIEALMCTIEALDGNDDPVTLRFADAEVPNSAEEYKVRVKTLGDLVVSPNDGGTFKFFGSNSIGSMTLTNVDGGLDYLIDYAVDGREVTIKVYGQDPFFYGTVDRMSWKGGEIEFQFKSLTEAMKKNHPSTTYGGTNVLPNGVDGLTTDIKGQIIPKLFGRGEQCSVKLVNTSKNIYQVSSRSTCTIDALYEAGAPITPTVGAEYTDIADMIANAPAAGYWRSYKGYVRSGSPLVRQVTVDAHDVKVLAGDVAEAVITELGYTMDSASKTALNAVGEVGIYIDGEINTSDILDRIAKSCGAYWYFIENVLYFTVIQLATTSLLTLYDFRRIRIERLASGAGSNGIPIHSFKMECEEVMATNKDTAGVVTAANKSRYSEQFRSVEHKIDATLTRHPLSEKVVIENGCLRNRADALTVCQRLGGLFSGRVDIIRYEAAFSADMPDLTSLGVGITVISDRLGYTEGRLMTVIGYQIRKRKKRIILDLIG